MNNPMIENVVFWMTVPFLILLAPFILMLVISIIRDSRARKQTKNNSWSNS